MVENHHNFAWKEMYEGNEVIVHRKGATPAGKNVLGIIPGSMTAPGFIVKGKGDNSFVKFCISWRRQKDEPYQSTCKYYA